MLLNMKLVVLGPAGRDSRQPSQERPPLVGLLAPDGQPHCFPHRLEDRPVATSWSQQPGTL